jgi:hypothetical protein
MVDFQHLASEARTYCETEQKRKFELHGACHENAIGAADYIRFETKYNPIIVWGVVSHKSEAESANCIEEVPEATTHFWVELENHQGIIDVYTTNPIVGDVSQYIESGISYGGEQLECYNTVEKFRYYGEVTPYDLCSKESFLQVLNISAMERV